MTFPTLLIFCLFALLLLLIIIIAIDLYLHYYSVYQRVHIGRWQDKFMWINKVKDVNKKWLQKTPTVKFTDNSRYVFLDLLKGNYRKTSIQSWQEAGALIGAISSNLNASHIDKFIESKIDMSTGKWQIKHEQLDSAILAYALCKASTDLNQIKPALDETIALINNCKGNDGTIYYRSTVPSFRFVDTIGFICPFLTFYGTKFNKPEYIDLALFQIKDYIKKGFLESPFIPAHAFDLSKNIPLGVYGWGRGLGWFILGIVDMYNELDNEHKEKDYLKSIIIKTAKDTLKFQKKDGGFNAMIGDDGSRHDSSITALAGWLFYNTYGITNDDEYIIASKKCVESLMKVTRRNGAIDFSQGDTKGIGIYASTFDIMPFTQGLTIRLAESLKKTG